VITADTVAATAAIVFGSAVVQRAVGFGFALFAVPAEAFVLPTKSAVVVVFLAGSVISLWLTVRLRAEVTWSVARTLGAGTAIGAPLGVVILDVVPAKALRLILGVTTCMAALWVIGSARLATRRDRVASQLSTLGLGLVGGVLNTSLSTSGPPLVFALRRRGFHSDRFRATISAVFVVANVVGLPLLAVAGLIRRADVELAATALLPCAVGMLLGARLGARMSHAHFTWAVDLLLLATGALTIARALG
jgi:uncharacterized membrane protein YfcA